MSTWGRLRTRRGLRNLALTGIAATVSAGLGAAATTPESEWYESLDKPNFEKYVKEANPDAKVEYRNANQDATQQQQQVEAAVTEGVDAIVLDPVDASAVSSALSKAEAKKIPVIAYDRFFEGADYYTSFDNKKIGNLQGQAVLEDPATGSACANLGGWLVSQGARDVSIEVDQGAAVGRPSRLLLDIDDRGGIHVGGRVESVGRGTCSLESAGA